MKKKVLSLLLVSVVALGVCLTGCGGSKEKTAEISKEYLMYKISATVPAEENDKKEIVPKYDFTDTVDTSKIHEYDGGAVNLTTDKVIITIDQKRSFPGVSPGGVPTIYSKTFDEYKDAIKQDKYGPGGTAKDTTFAGYPAVRITFEGDNFNFGCRYYTDLREINPKMTGYMDICIYTLDDKTDIDKMLEDEEVKALIESIKIEAKDKK